MSRTEGDHGPAVAVIGCGYWGRNLVRNFNDLRALAAVCDRNPETLSRISADFADATPLDFASVLTSNDVAAVAIAAPATEHFLLAREALLAGKHVFVEKPLALDVSDAEELCELAERSGLTLMVGHLLQYHPGFVALQRLLHEGGLGRLQYLYSNRLNLGKFRREEDILWSFAPHDISMILSLVGSEPDSVYATGGAYLHKAIADVTTTHLSFPGGERAHIFVSWLHPFKEQKLVVVGDRGMAVFDDSKPWDSKIALYRHRIDWLGGTIPEAVRAEAEYLAVEAAEPLAVECKHFLDCVALGHRPHTDGREGVRVLRVLEQAADSMATPRAAARHDRALRQRHGVMIHESAYVDERCYIGAGTKIWHFSHILPGSSIGTNCTIGQNVMVGPDVRVGDRCKIQNNVSIYKGVTLEDDVFCGPSCVFTNVVNPRAAIDRKGEFTPTIVGRGSTIGANATIVCGNSLGAYSFVAAGAVVTKDVPAHVLVAGVPARRIGWMSHDGERLGDDMVCPRSGRRYELMPDETVREIRG